MPKTFLIHMSVPSRSRPDMIKLWLQRVFKNDRVEVTNVLPAPDKHLEFQECTACAALPGTPPLCKGCLQNRTTISDANALIFGKPS